METKMKEDGEDKQSHKLYNTIVVVIVIFGISFWVISLMLIYQDSRSQTKGNINNAIDVFLGIDDNIAVVGKLFRYTIPDNAFQGDISVIKVETASLPQWLSFNSVTYTFRGVAVESDIGVFMVDVVAFSPDDESTTTSFLIQVQAANVITDSKVLIAVVGGDYNNKKKIICDWDQQIIKASLLLDTSISDLDPDGRVTLLEKWSDHLNQDIFSLTLRPRSGGSVFNKLMDTKIIIAGPGDASPQSNNPGVELTWMITCGDFTQKREIEAVLTRNIENGNVRNVLGFLVIGWYVTESMPFGGLEALRKKRQAGAAFRTPIPTPSVSPIRPTATILPTASSSYPVITPTSTIAITVNVTGEITTASYINITTTETPPLLVNNTTLYTGIINTTPILPLVNVTSSFPTTNDTFTTPYNNISQQVTEHTSITTTQVNNVTVFNNSITTEVPATQTAVNNVTVFNNSITTEVPATQTAVNNVTVFNNSITTDVPATQTAVNNVTVFNNSITTEVPATQTEVNNVTVFNDSVTTDVPAIGNYTTGAMFNITTVESEVTSANYTGPSIFSTERPVLNTTLTPSNTTTFPQQNVTGFLTTINITDSNQTSNNITTVTPNILSTESVENITLEATTIGIVAQTTEMILNNTLFQTTETPLPIYENITSATPVSVNVSMITGFTTNFPNISTINNTEEITTHSAIYVTEGFNATTMPMDFTTAFISTGENITTAVMQLEGNFTTASLTTVDDDITTVLYPTTQGMNATLSTVDSEVTTQGMHAILSTVDSEVTTQGMNATLSMVDSEVTTQGMNATLSMVDSEVTTQGMNATFSTVDSEVTTQGMNATLSTVDSEVTTQGDKGVNATFSTVVSEVTTQGMNATLSTVDSEVTTQGMNATLSTVDSEVTTQGMNATFSTVDSEVTTQGVNATFSTVVSEVTTQGMNATLSTVDSEVTTQGMNATFSTVDSEVTTQGVNATFITVVSEVTTQGMNATFSVVDITTLSPSTLKDSGNISDITTLIASENTTEVITTLQEDVTSEGLNQTDLSTASGTTFPINATLEPTTESVINEFTAVSGNMSSLFTTEISTVSPIGNITMKVTTQAVNITTDEITTVATGVTSEMTTEASIPVSTNKTNASIPTTLALTSPTTEGSFTTVEDFTKVTTVHTTDGGVVPTTLPLADSTPLPDSAPTVVNRTNYIQTWLGTSFEYLVPADTFHDYQNGNTRALSLSLLTETMEQILPDHWIQFRPGNQIIYGLPLQFNYMKTQGDFHKVVLVANNSIGLSTNMVIALGINDSTVSNVSFEFYAELWLNSLTLENNHVIPYTTDDIISFVNQLSLYFGDTDSTLISITDINQIDNSTVLIKWTNNSISKLECLNGTISDMFMKISPKESITQVRTFFLPKYSIKSTGMEWMGVCLYLQPNTTAIPTSVPAGTTSDLNILLVAIVPALIVIIIILIIIIVVCCIRSKRRPTAGRYIPDDEKPIFSNNRKPVILPGEIEAEDALQKPRKPVYMESDNDPSSPFTYNNPGYVGPEAGTSSKRDPPPYISHLPTPVPSNNDQESLGTHPGEPVPYSSEMSAPYDYEPFNRYRTMPPQYGLPQIYIENHGFSQI